MGIYLGQLPPAEIARFKAELAETLIANFCYPRFFDPRTQSLRMRPVDRAKRQEVWLYLSSVDFTAWSRVDLLSPDFQHQIERLFILFVQRNRSFFGEQGRKRMFDIRTSINSCAISVAQGLRNHLSGQKPTNPPFGSPRPVVSWSAASVGGRSERSWEQIAPATMLLQQQLQEARGEVKPPATPPSDGRTNGASRRSVRTQMTAGTNGIEVDIPQPHQPQQPPRTPVVPASPAASATPVVQRPPVRPISTSGTQAPNPSGPLSGSHAPVRSGPLASPQVQPVPQTPQAPAASSQQSHAISGPLPGPTKSSSKIPAASAIPATPLAPATRKSDPLISPVTTPVDLQVTSEMPPARPQEANSMRSQPPSTPTVRTSQVATSPALAAMQARNASLSNPASSPMPAMATGQRDASMVALAEDDIAIFEQMRHQLVLWLRVESVTAGLEISGQGPAQLLELLRQHGQLDETRLQVVSTLLNLSNQVIKTGLVSLIDYKQALMFHLMHTRR